jgi:ureidoglycolate hydrolase
MVQSEAEPNNPMKTTYPSLATVILLLGSLCGSAQTKTWTGAGDGVSWGNGANWSGGVVPGPANDVAITNGAGSVVVISSLDVVVRSIQCTKAFTISGRVLTLTSGASQFSGPLSISNNATLTVDNPGSIVTASGATLAADNDFYALNGGVIRLLNLRSVTNNNQNATWRADGTGSLVDLSLMTNVTLGFSRVLYVQAYNGGAVDVHRVAAAPGAVQVDAQDAGSVVDLSGVAGRWTSLGSSDLILHAQTGASILIPNVLQLEHASLRMDNTGIIPTAQLTLLTNVTLTVDGCAPNFGRVTNIDDTEVYALNGGMARLTNVFRVTNGNQNATWRSDGAGSLVDLSRATNLTLGFSRVLYVQAYNGGAVDVHRLASAPGAVQVDAQDAGSVVDLSGVAGRWTSLGSSDLILHVQTGASILIPNVTQLEHASLRMDNTGTIPTAQLTLLTNVTLTVDGCAPNFGRVTNIDDTEVYALNGGMARLTNVFRVSNGNQNATWRADGTGSLVDLSLMTDLTMGFSRVLYVQAYSGGAVDTHRLRSAPGAVQVDAQDAGSVVDLSGLAGRWTSLGTSDLILRVQTGASILIPNVTQLEHASLRVDNSGAIPTAQLNLLTNVTLTVDGCAPNFGRVTNIDDTDVYALNGGIARLTNVFRVSNGNQNATWRADGAGSLVSLSSVTNVTLGFSRVLYVQAYSGGAVDMHRLASAPGAVQVDAQDAGSVVDLSGVAGRWTSLGSSDLILHAQTGASILIPNVTQLEHASLRMDNTGIISTAQLNLLTNVTLTVDACTPNFGRITNIDDTEVYAINGGMARLTNVFRVTEGNQNPTWQANGSGSLVDLSALIHLTVGYSRVLYVQAYGGGKVDVRGLTSLSTGPVQLTADGTGSLIDASGLSSFVSIGSSASSLTARNAGAISLNSQVLLLANVAINIPPGNPILPPTLAASPTLTLYGQPGHSFWIEKRDTRSDLNPWMFVARVPLTNAFQVVAPAASPNTEYRVWDFVADPPIIDILPAAGHQIQLVIYDTPGRTNQLLTATTLAPGTQWQAGPATVMTNAFLTLPPTAASDPVRFFRAKRL